MESIKTILNNLKEFKSWKDIWKETEETLKSRESLLATEYAHYCLDVRQELMDRPMNFREWYDAKKIDN